MVKWIILIVAVFSLGLAHADQVLVNVYGNRALKAEAIIKMAGLDQDEEMSAEEVRKRLITTSLFSRVETARQGMNVVIYVREKTTWFILPYFSIDPSATTYGVAFGKVTLLGQDASLLGRFQLGTNDREASLLVRDETVFGTPFVWGFSLDYEDAQHRIYRGRDVVQRTQNEYHGGSFQAGYKFSPYWTLSLNNYVERHRFEEISGQYFSGFQWSHKLFADYNKLYVNEGLTDGLASRVYGEITNPISTFHFYKLGSSLAAGLFHHGNFNVITRARGEYSPSLPRYQQFELGGGKFRGFPIQQFRDRYYVVSQNDVLLTSLSFWVLHFRPLVFLDYAFIQSQGHASAGAGFQVFLRDVAVPAVQFFAGYGINPAGFATSAAIGPSF